MPRIEAAAIGPHTRPGALRKPLLRRDVSPRPFNPPDVRRPLIAILFAQLHLAWHPLRIHHRDREIAPAPFRLPFSPAAGLDRDQPTGPGVDQGDIFQALTLGRRAGIIVEQSGAGTSPEGERLEYIALVDTRAGRLIAIEPGRWGERQADWSWSDLSVMVVDPQGVLEPGAAA